MSWTTDTYQVDMPEIYQIELTNACNLRCSGCIRTDSRVRRPIGFFSLDLLKMMIARKDFRGSYFVELQMYGEPLLNLDITSIIQQLKEQGVKVGMSTNGTIPLTADKIIRDLDYLTISIDSPDPVRYEDLRQGAKFKNILNNTLNMIDQVKSNGGKVDLQTIRYWDQESELPALEELAKGWNVTCREVPDCFAAYQNRPWPGEQRNTICLNPWLSVSVQWDGDVVACCFAAGKQIVYGNLYQNDLYTIWNKSPIRKEFVEGMRKNLNLDIMPCKMCYMRSPALFHIRMLMEDMKK